MTADNPFISITFNENDIVVDRINEKVDLQMGISRILLSGGVIVLKGKPGVGKSTLVGVILKDLKKSSKIEVIREDFTPAVYNMIRKMNLRGQKKKLMILDDFNNLELVDKGSQEKMTDLIYSISSELSIVLIENRDSGVEKDFKRLGRRFDEMELGGLSKEDLKRVIINRLNSVRKKRSDSIEPFTEDEYQKIYKKSEGNPRIALLICSAMYDQKSAKIV